MTKDKGIRLHPTKGVNPKMTVCRGCGKDVGIALIGAEDWIYKCKDCGANFIGRPDPGVPCRKEHHTIEKVREIGEHEKLPIELCDECAKKEEAAANAVKEGGVFWRCTDCGSNGAILAESPMAIAVRKQLNIKAPNPCGVEFSKKDCPVCSAQKPEEAVQ